MKKDKWQLLLLCTVLSLAFIYFRSFLSLSNYPLGSDAFTWITNYSYRGNILPYILTEAYKPAYANFFFNGIVQIFLKMMYSLFNNVLITKAFVILLYVLAGLGMYKFVKELTKSEVGAFSASLLYLVNIRIFDHLLEGHYGILLAYTLAPFMFYYMKRVLDLCRPKDVALLSFLFAVLLTSAHISAAAIFLLFLSIFTLFTLISRKDNRIKRFKTLLLLFAFSGGLVAYFFIPFFAIPFAEQELADPARTHDLIERWSLPQFDAISLTQGEWVNRDFYPWYINSWAIFPQILIIFLVWSSIILCRDKYIYLFGACSLLSILLSTGFYPLGHGAYFSLTQNLPFFYIFRTVGRWQLFTVFGYSVMFGYSIKYLDLKLRKLKLRVPKVKFLSRKPIFQICFILLISTSILAPSVGRIAEGAKVYEYPSSFLDGLRWVGGREGDFNVIVLPYGGEWHRVGGERGWFTHDFGQKSPMFTKKPVVGVSVANPLSSDFLSFVKDELESPKTPELSKILSLANTRYVVGYDYLENLFTHEYIMKAKNQMSSLIPQKGLIEVFKDEYSSVYEVKNWNGLFTAPTDSLIVVGGREALIKLAEIEGLDFSKLVVLFADQIIKERGTDTFLDFVNKSKALVFVNADIKDLVMLMLPEVLTVDPSQYAFPSKDIEKFWISEDFAIRRGMFTLNRMTLSTAGSNEIKIPIYVNRDGNYETWVRVLYGPDRGNLEVFIGNEKIGMITPSALDYVGFRWAKVGNLELKAGKHVLTVKNGALQFGIRNDLDEILLVEPGKVEDVCNGLIRFFNTIRVISIFDRSAIKGLSETSFSSLEEMESVAISDDDQSAFWRNLNPDYVTLSNDNDTPRYASRNSLKIEIRRPGRNYFALIDKQYPQFQDWSEDAYFSLWFKGEGTGVTFQLMIFFDDTYDNWVMYEFVDDSADWRELVFPKTSYSNSRGRINWRNVWRIVFANVYKDLTGIFRVDELKRIGGGHRFEFDYFFPKSAKHVLGVRAEKGPGYGDISLSLENKEWLFKLDSLYLTGTETLLTDEIFLKAGSREISISTDGKAYWHDLAIFSVFQNETFAKFSDLFKMEKDSIITSRKSSPTEYTIDVETQEPIFLIFSESYHPLWRAYVNGEEFEPFPVYSFANAFYIPVVGKYNVTINFVGQRYVWYGLAISMITFVIILMYLVTDWRGYSFPKFGRKMKNPEAHLVEEGKNVLQRPGKRNKQCDEMGKSRFKIFV